MTQTGKIDQLDLSLYSFLLPFASHRLDRAARLWDRHHSLVLDLGCGNGDFLQHNRQKFDRALGLDLAAPVSRQTTRIKFLRHDLNYTLPVKTRTVDLAVSISTIEYLLDPYYFLREIRRVLKPGGELILHTLNLAFIKRRLELGLGRLPTFNKAPGWQSGIVHNFTWPTTEKLLTDQGFIITARSCSGLYPHMRLWWPNLLAGDILLKALKK